MFDSGFGGLTVARAVIDLLPHEHLVYVGDTGRYPYGAKPLEDVAGPLRNSHCRPIHGRRHLARFGCIDTGWVELCWMYTSRWSCMLAPTPGRSE